MEVQFTCSKKDLKWTAWGVWETRTPMGKWHTNQDRTFLSPWKVPSSLPSQNTPPPSGSPCSDFCHRKLAWRVLELPRLHPFICLLLMSPAGQVVWRLMGVCNVSYHALWHFPVGMQPMRLSCWWAFELFPEGIMLRYAAGNVCVKSSCGCLFLTSLG